jgi:hypothetical protein
MQYLWLHYLLYLPRPPVDQTWGTWTSPESHRDPSARPCKPCVRAVNSARRATSEIVGAAALELNAAPLCAPNAHHISPRSRTTRLRIRTHRARAMADLRAS